MGPEDDWDPELRGPGVNTPSYGKWKPPGPISDISQLWFRQERQVLRRLPRSGAIVWMVHTYIEPLVNVTQEAGVPGRLASQVRSWDEKMAAYVSDSTFLQQIRFADQLSLLIIVIKDVICTSISLFHIWMSFTRGR